MFMCLRACMQPGVRRIHLHFSHALPMCSMYIITDKMHSSLYILMVLSSELKPCSQLRSTVACLALFFESDSAACRSLQCDLEP